MIIDNDYSASKKKYDEIAKKHVDLVCWLAENHLEVLQKYNTQKYGGD